MVSVQTFWDKFCLENQLNGIQYKEAFQFGVDPDLLAQLVVEGKKTATTSGYIFYELENEDLPQVGEYSIVLNSKDEPVAVIRTESVEVLPMNEVSEEFVLAEGEGDYKTWWDAHEKFFTEILKEYNKEFSPDMLVVCERFKTVYTTK
jgi:uncharacterized protein YhfF